MEILTAGKVGDRGALGRFWWEQNEVPRLVRKTGAELLLSTGNFAVWNSPVPQILLSRNSLYTSRDFSRDLLRRGEYGLWADTRLKGFLARQSIQRAQLAVAPSHAFARELRDWSGREVAALHHGFDREFFFCDGTATAAHVEEKLKSSEGAVRLLFVSHYNYYRNFETLFRAVALLKQLLPARQIRLLLTCELARGKNPGNYRTEEATTLLRELRIEPEVVQLGAIPYPQLHHVYRAGDLYVTPAYTETFAHPLVEAMACGLPIVASDLDVHREITNGAALFFAKFSPRDLAEKVGQLLDSPSLFSWSAHAQHLLDMAKTLASARA